MYALATDGVVEASSLANWKESTLKAIEMAKTQAQAQLAAAAGRTMLGGDTRFALLTPSDVQGQTTAAAEGWARRLLGRMPIECAVVGDMKLEQVEPLICRYVGSLPAATQGADALDGLRKLSRGNGPYVESAKYESITPQGMVLAGYIGSEGTQIEDRRQLSMVSSILQVRMDKRLREEMQLVYSIGCAHRPAEGMPGTGQIVASGPADASNIEPLATEILAMMKEFAEQGPTDDEVDVARKQITNQLTKQLLEPTFWLRQLSQLEYRGHTLDEYKTIVEHYQSFTAAQLQATAARYFVPERQIRLAAVPAAPAAP
jgi:zinc protease